MLKPLRKILLIHPEGNVLNNPSLKAIVDHLCTEGIHCTIVSRRMADFCQGIPGVDQRLDGPFWWRAKAAAINVLCSPWLTRLLIRLQWRNGLAAGYDLVVGVDRQGLIEAYFISSICKVPVALISFEIMSERETFARFKRLERIASTRVALWIIQDEFRAHRLAAENGLDTKKAFYLPVASRGLGTSSAIRLRDRLGIDKDKKVVIAIGSIEKWTMIQEVIQSVPLWPQEWVLIVHERYGSTQQRIAGLNIAAGSLDSRLYLSDEATRSVDELGQILSGISYGLAFYRTLPGTRYWGDNLKYIGRSSGKIATYLRYGIPVITNDIGMMADDIRRFRLGHILRSPADLPTLLVSRNLSDPPDWSKNCRRYFTTHLDFGIYAEALISRLANAANLSGLRTEKTP